MSIKGQKIIFKNLPTGMKNEKRIKIIKNTHKVFKLSRNTLVTTLKKKVVEVKTLEILKF
jgi:hypothetical protein